MRKPYKLVLLMLSHGTLSHVP